MNWDCSIMVLQQKKQTPWIVIYQSQQTEFIACFLRGPLKWRRQRIMLFAVVSVVRGGGEEEGATAEKMQPQPAKNTACKQTHLGLFIGRLTGVKLYTPVISFIALVVILCSPQSEFSTAYCFAISLDSPSSQPASFANHYRTCYYITNDRTLQRKIFALNWLV